MVGPSSQRADGDARAGWIVDPQAIKPGVRMPSNQLESRDLQALLAYLETLR